MIRSVVQPPAATLPCRTVASLTPPRLLRQQSLTRRRVSRTPTATEPAAHRSSCSQSAVYPGRIELFVFKTRPTVQPSRCQYSSWPDVVTTTIAVRTRARSAHERYYIATVMGFRRTSAVSAFCQYGRKQVEAEGPAFARRSERCAHRCVRLVFVIFQRYH